MLIVVLNQTPGLKSNMMLTLCLAGKQDSILYSPFLLPDLQDNRIYGSSNNFITVYLVMSLFFSALIIYCNVKIS